MNHYDCRNKGDHSALSAMLYSLKADFADSETTVLSHYPSTDQIRCGKETRILECIPVPSSGLLAQAMTLADMSRCLVWALLSRYLKVRVNRIVPPKKVKTVEAYVEANVVLSRSIDWFNDVYDVKTFATGFYEILISVLLGKKTMIYAHSIGPFGNSLKGMICKSLLKTLLSRVDLITVREPNSQRFLKSIGLTGPRVYLTADPAFLLSPASRARVEEILAREGIFRDSSTSLIGVNISQLAYWYSFDWIDNISEKYDRYVRLMAELIDRLTLEPRTVVILIPHVFGPPIRDDRRVSKDVFNLVTNKQKVKMIKNEYTPEELRGIIGQLDVFLGMRMHAIIHSLSMCIPTVAIDYMGKTTGIMETLDQSDLVCHSKNLSLDELLLKVNMALQNQEKIKKRLAYKMEYVQKRAMQNAVLLRRLIGSKPTQLSRKRLNCQCS